MTVHELDKRLGAALDNFASEMQAQYDDYSKEHAVKGDIAELSRQTFYALNEFRKEIISYLNAQQ
ncbi:hypothetical protein B5G43_05905 [Flavonifractor sp. An92]|uniref:hypothetical protein n=1 Tax=Flavonifractor sp. An92 TaxID=1965666 RepID=UPI000B388A92|nr:MULTISPECIES: hypothetical protein [unclassified Flavonifractor]OUN07137.1 hypothetical protein B5G43_05905 [Flavonifractor sp. An92]OUQ25694.1 hypothetical protein B5E80_03655 [Flavonifractor sp. An135]